MSIFKSIFSKNGTWSSKRIFGGLGLLIVFGSYIYCMSTNTELPSCTEFIVATCASLLGVDSVVNAISKNRNNSSSETNEEMMGD